MEYSDWRGETDGEPGVLLQRVVVGAVSSLPSTRWPVALRNGACSWEAGERTRQPPLPGTGDPGMKVELLRVGHIGPASVTQLTPSSSSHPDEREVVQKKTFTKWVNSHLARVSCRISDLYKDLRDGRMLIKLLEVLSGEMLVKPLPALASSWAHQPLFRKDMVRVP